MTSVYEDSTSWRLQTGSAGVPYRILGMEGSFGTEDADLTMKVLISASDLLAFATEMFPPPYFFGDWPVYPAVGRVYGTGLNIARFSWKGHIDGKPVDPLSVDPNAPAGTYQQNCELSLEFSTKRSSSTPGSGSDQQSESDPNDPFTFLEISCSGAGEFIHSTAPKAKWTDSEILQMSDPSQSEPNKLQTTPVSILVPEVEWDVNWPRVPHNFYKNTLVTRLRNALGKVNSDTMSVLFDAPKETILFVGYSLRQSYTWRTQTQPPFQLNLKFLEKHVIDGEGNVRGHNDFWKADVGWQRLLYDGDNPVYAQANLNAVFNPSYTVT